MSDEMCKNLLDGKAIDALMKRQTRCQFHQHFTRSFYACRSQKRKNVQLSHQYLFTLLGSESVKAVCRTLMKLSPGEVVKICSFPKPNQTNIIILSLPQSVNHFLNKTANVLTNFFLIFVKL